MVRQLGPGVRHIHYTTQRDPVNLPDVRASDSVIPTCRDLRIL